MSTKPHFDIVLRRNPGRWVSSVILLLIALALINEVSQNRVFHFSTVAQYIIDPRILAGVCLTIYITFASMIIGLFLGAIVAVMRLSSNPVMRVTSGGFIWVFRGTPTLVQLIFWFNIAIIFPTITLKVPGFAPFFSVPTNHVMTGVLAALLGLGLNEGAYMAEIVRAGILSVDSGQREAAKALGLTPRLTLMRVILPQALRVIIPPTGNQFVSLLKASSLVSVIAAGDLLTEATRIYNDNFRILELLVVASFWYLVLTTLATVAQHFIEKRVSRGFAASARKRPGNPPRTDALAMPQSNLPPSTEEI
ncbi:amino acid ABC transporter permease [Paraburkholderia sp.]|uniref:amino acid ABC transporter permease n=1 Tax=Paraburkholderia sp. TaxID=1926495 RepID=UPI0039E5591F